MGLLEETKAAIGFVDKAKTCATCAHCIEKAHPVLERSWFKQCNISNLCPFVTDDNSSCQRHESRADT